MSDRTVEWAELMLDEPLHWFVRDRGSSAAHHLDYVAPLGDRALCGHGFAEIRWQGTQRPRSVCRRCQEVMPSHEAKWWKKVASRQNDERAMLAAKMHQLQSELRDVEDELQAARARSAVLARDDDDPLNWFVRDRGSRVAHHLDYGAPDADHALCGHPFAQVLWEGPDRPRAVCVRCQQGMPAHEAQVWQQRAQREALARHRAEALSRKREGSNGATEAEVESLRQKVANQRDEIRRLLEQRRVLTDSPPKGAAGRGSRRKPPALPRLVKDAPPSPGTSWNPPTYKPPRIRVISGGLPGLGKRR